MKLSSHYNQASIFISVSVLLISAVIYYAAINQIAKKQLDDNLTEEIAEIVSYITLNHRLPKQVDFDEDQTTFVKTNQTEFTTRYSDTSYINPKDKGREQGRAIAALVSLKGDRYIATIIVSRESTEYLIQVISIITLILTTLLLSIVVITNKYVLNGLWRPFYYILSHVQQFNVADSVRIETIKSNVDEFQELSEAVSTMSLRVSSDYQGLKAFTENASHEMMTPIAVITSKLDTLIQDERLASDQLFQITDIYSATNRLSRLNQSLLLLVKIDNDLIQDVEQLNLKPLLQEKIQQFQELIQNKNVELEHTLFDKNIIASKYLIDILINNLFSNAIRHNKIPGDIKITLTDKKLVFQNSGNPVPLQQELIFKRFYKGKSSDGIGLGLAVIKNICSKYNYGVGYQFFDNMHSFIIDF